MGAQRAFGYHGWRFVISLQLTLVFLAQQAQPWSLTCKTHVILNYEAIFLDFHAQLGKVCMWYKEICGGHQPRGGRKWNIAKALLQHSCFSHPILLVWESLQSQNIQGREESCKHKSGIAGKTWLSALRAENLENGALVNGYLLWKDHRVRLKGWRSYCGF